MLIRSQQLILGLLFLLVSACNLGEEVNSITEFNDGKKVWVFIQFNVEQNNKKFEDYYYFGQINSSLYKKITSRKIQRGFITLKKVRYWANDDSIKSYSDELYSDEMLFRVEDIRKMDLLKIEPKPGFKYSYEKDLASETAIDKIR